MAPRTPPETSSGTETGEVTMKTHDSTTSTPENRTLASAPDATDKRSMRSLTERELERVAAAGGKGGISGGDVHHRR